jgi:hypothetical protein
MKLYVILSPTVEVLWNWDRLEIKFVLPIENKDKRNPKISETIEYYLNCYIIYISVKIMRFIY